MPRYDYRCDDCGWEVELERPITADLPESVPCGRKCGEPARRCDGRMRQVLRGGIEPILGRDFPGEAIKREGLDSDQPDGVLGRDGRARLTQRGRRRRARNWR